MDKLIKYENRVVITTKQLAEAYETSDRNISNNFNNNSKHFKLGRHYFLLTGDELREFKRNSYDIGVAQNVNKLYLWTERGANRHCKILDTDKAWEQFENLEECYFNARNNAAQPQLPATYVQALEHLLIAAKENEQLQLENKEKEQKIIEYKPKAEKWNAYLDSDGLSTIDDFSKALGVKDLGRNNMYKYLRNKKVLRKDNSPFQNYVEQGLFCRKSSGHYLRDGVLEESYKTFLTSKGIDKVMNFLINDGFVNLN